MGKDVAGHILLAEDDPVIGEIIRDHLEACGMHVTVIADGRTAWDRLQSCRPGYDAIVLDRGLPNVDGMDLLARIKTTPYLSHVPVIMETALDDEASIRDGLQQGAYYYLTKPFRPEILVAVVKSAVQQSRELRDMLESVRRAERPLAMLHAGTFRFRELDEARLLANYLARACPDPDRVIRGLQELLVNAVEHGNLEITYTDKSALLLSDDWEDEVARRLTLPQYRDRVVEVEIHREPHELEFRIRDQGPGFDWRRFLDFDPERAFDLHGRGIAMARQLSFDRLQYQGSGNTVLAGVHLGGS